MEITEATIGHQNQLTIRPKNQVFTHYCEVYLNMDENIYAVSNFAFGA